MGVSAALARYAGRRAHVLLAEVPGNWELRALVERRMFARGWCQAMSPADADILAVCGHPGPEFAGNVDLIWDQMPGPRVRVEVRDAGSVDSVLARAAAELLDTESQRRDAATRCATVEPHADDSGSSESHTGQQDSHHGGMDHGDMDHGGMDHGDMDHGGMDHGGMDMAPAGIALAEGADDRDGLEMDVLQMFLGPVLAYWPSGLVLKCCLHGDVLADAEARVLDAGFDSGRPVLPAQRAAPEVAARECDHITNLLALAGWSSAARHAREIRDLLLEEPSPTDRAQPLLEKLQRKLQRSWVLRWSLRDLARLSDADVEQHRLPTTLAGDTYDRLLAHVGNALALLSNQLENNAFGADADDITTALPDLVRGLEMASARLVVASLGVDIAPAESGSRG